MDHLIVAALVLLAAVGQVSVATAQAAVPPATSTPPPPIPLNEQPLPWWFKRIPSMPGMPRFYRAPTPPPTRQCRIAYWYPAQYWNTDQWGHTVTWVSYAPQYACN